MKRRITALLICVVCFVLFAGSAFSADKRFYLGAYGLYAWGNLDEQQTKDKFTGPIEVKFDDTWGMQLRGGYLFNKTLTVEAMFEYIAPFEALTGANKDELDVKNFSLNAKITFPMNERFIPYLIVGIGVMNAHEDIVFNNATSETSDWGAGFRGGLGIDLYVHESISLGLEGVYVTGSGNVDHIRYSSLALGISYHF